VNGRAAKKKELSKRGGKPSAYRRVVTENVNGEGRRLTNRYPPTSSRQSPATGTRSSGRTRAFQTSARSKGLTAFPARSFRDLAAEVFNS
jgi:hypothetical protein